MNADQIAARIEAEAPVHFLHSAGQSGVHPLMARKIMDAPTAVARALIRNLALFREDKAALEDAYELFLAESGRVIYYPGPNMKRP